MNTVVIQSYRTENVAPWIERCIDSVHAWAVGQGFDYRFVGDEIFEMVPDWYRENAGQRAPVITDLARLKLLREELDGGAARAVWLDADVLVFDSAGLSVPAGMGYAFGREFWVQPAAGKKLKIYRNVHNAIAVFEAGNAFLDFYIHACERIISGANGSVPNQVVGTKFLTALHNIMGFSLIDQVGMFSPLVNRDIAAGGGPALDRLEAVCRQPLAAANLCSSLAGGEADGVELSDDLMANVCETLLTRRTLRGAAHG